MERGVHSAGSGPLRPNAVIILAGTTFGLQDQFGPGGPYWASTPFQVRMTDASHLYRFTGGWTSRFQTGVLVNDDDAPFVLYLVPFRCVPGEDCPTPRIPSRATEASTCPSPLGNAAFL